MSKLIETEKGLEETLKDVEKILVLFYASWCPFSQRFLPVFEKHAKKAEQNTCRVLTDAVETCEDEFGIEVVPTVIYFEKGKPAKRLDGEHGIGLTERQLIEMMEECGL